MSVIHEWMCMQHWWNDADRESCSKQRKPVPVPPWPPQTPHGLTRDWTQACVMSGWWLTAWAMAQEACELLLCCPVTVGEVPETSYSFYLSFQAHTRIVPQIMIDCSSTHQHASCTLHSHFAGYSLSQYSNVYGTGNLHGMHHKTGDPEHGVKWMNYLSRPVLHCFVLYNANKNNTEYCQHTCLSCTAYSSNIGWYVYPFVLINSAHFTMYSGFKLLHSCKWLCMPIGGWYRCTELHNDICCCWLTNVQCCA